MRCLNAQCTAKSECAKYAERDNPSLQAVNVSGIADKSCPFFSKFKNTRLRNIISSAWIGSV